MRVGRVPKPSVDDFDKFWRNRTGQTIITHSLHRQSRSNLEENSMATSVFKLAVTKMFQAFQLLYVKR